MKERNQLDELLDLTDARRANQQREGGNPNLDEVIKSANDAISDAFKTDAKASVTLD